MIYITFSKVTLMDIEINNTLNNYIEKELYSDKMIALLEYLIYYYDTTATNLEKDGLKNMSEIYRTAKDELSICLKKIKNVELITKEDASIMLKWMETNK